MSAGCCDIETVDRLAAEQSRRATLYAVLVINALMFVGELAAGIWADSRALMADSADNLGDALVYGISLFVLTRSLRWRAAAAFAKGLIQLVFGLALIASIISALMGEPDPVGPAIMATAALALVGNLTCLVLLSKHRSDDVNMRSVWLCSRNDVISNSGVIVSGGLVIMLDSWWPDILIASVVAAIFLHTAIDVLRDAWRNWQQDSQSGSAVAAGAGKSCCGDP